MKPASPFSLMVHGGAGTLDDVEDGPTAARYLDAIRGVLEQGRARLAAGAAAIEAVEVCAALLEDEPLFNAGRGSVLNESGSAEMDAAIMDGRGLEAGAVAGVQNIANPVRLARLVMDRSEHVMLVGDGAMHFAGRCEVPRVPDSYFQTPERLEQLERARLSGTMMLDHDAADGGDRKLGTIGVVARDRHGDLAAATSTGGIVNKRRGRVGDSPIIGAGVYADNESCAVSATGYGEAFMRAVLAKTIADHMLMQGLDAEQAATAGIAYLSRRVGGRGGVIVIGRDGRCISRLTTKRMVHGWIEHGGETVARF